MSFGKRLVFYRNQAGYNQKQLAEKLNILPTRLNYWEKDKREPDVEMIKALASALCVSSDELLGIKKESPKPEGTEDSQDIESIACALENILIQLGFIQSGEDITDADYRFLRSVVALIQAYFDDGS